MLLTGFEYDQTAGSRGLVIIFFAPTPTHGLPVVFFVFIIKVDLLTLIGSLLVSGRFGAHNPNSRHEYCSASLHNSATIDYDSFS